MAPSSSSPSPAIPLQWVDDSEFQAMESALALAIATSVCKRPETTSSDATSARKRSKISSSGATSDDRIDDSAGRANIVAEENRTPALPGQKRYHSEQDMIDEDRVSINHIGAGRQRFKTDEDEDRVSVTNNFSKGSEQCKADEDEVRVSVNISAESETARCRRFEAQQAPSFWAFARPHHTATAKPVVPKINFGGRIVYSRTRSEVEKASLDILQIIKSKKANTEGRIPMGFDIEWKPFYNRVREIPSKAAVIQICLDADRCDVIHIIHSGIPPVLQSLLEDGSSVKVGVCIGGDALKMRNDYNVHVRELEDLSSIACQKLRPLRRWSLSALCEKLTGKEVDKPTNIRCGNWEVHNLSLPQLQYAATDAYASWYLYEALKSLPDFPVVNPNEEENH